MPTKPVLGIKSDEVERPKPLFYMKPVNQDGLGIRGPEGERLEDLGKIGCDSTIGRWMTELRMVVTGLC